MIGCGVILRSTCRVVGAGIGERMHCLAIGMKLPIGVGIVEFTRKGHELLLRIEESAKLTIALLDGLSLVRNNKDVGAVLLLIQKAVSALLEGLTPHIQVRFCR